MPQVQLPIFPAGVTHINSEVAFEERDGKVYYFNGHLPVLPGANSTARSAAKTDYLTVNCSNSHKSSCPKKWSPNKSKPISARRVYCSRPLKNAAPKSSNLKLNARRFSNTSRSKISLSKMVAFDGQTGLPPSSALADYRRLGREQRLTGQALEAGVAEAGQ